MSADSTELATGSSAPPRLAPLDGRAALRRRLVVDRLVQAMVGAVAFSAISAVVLIFFFVFREALPLFLSAEVQQEVTLGRTLFPPSWDVGEALRFSWQPVSTVPKYSLLPLALGTLKVTLVAVVTAVPLAIAAALFATEFASRRVREIVKPIVELLAGIPSVVLGFFALVVLATLVQDLFGFPHRLNAVTAGLALGLAIVPVVYSVSEDALLAVPRSYREAALALGASRARTAWSVVLPAASPGLFAAIVLGFGRAMGETMIVLMASGNAAMITLDPRFSVRTIPATIAAEMGEVVVGGAHWSVLFWLGALLFLVTLAFNSLGGWYVARLRRRLGGTAS